MYKLRKEIAKAKSQLIADAAISTYNHKIGTFIFRNHIDYKTKRMEASVIAYEF